MGGHRRPGVKAAEQVAPQSEQVHGSRQRAQDDLAQLLLQPHHLLGRDFLGGLRDTGNQAGVLDREKALGNLDGHDDGDGDGRQEHAEHDRLVAQRHIVRGLTAGAVK